MTRALFKKQMMEAFSWLYFSRKNGKKRSGVGIAVYALLYLVIFVSFGYVVFLMAEVLCEPLCAVGFGWLYFALISMVAIVCGVFGSVFSTYASLYQAKDNDLLLSMPIPVSKILMVRLSSVYIMGLMYEQIVMIPGIIVWFLFENVSPIGVVFSILIPFVLSFFILTLSCILGWVVALINSRVKNKSLVTVVLSLAFIAAYYYVYYKAYAMLTGIIANAANIAKNVKSILYPLYHLGLAAEGNLSSMLIFTGIIAVLFAIVYLVLSKSFLKLATTNLGTGKVRYKERTAKAGSADGALLYKEFKRFTGSANYMMNCGLGILFMLIAAGALLLKGEVLVKFLPLLYAGAEEFIPLLLTAVLCMVVSMNDITAPSISLEGKHLWLVQVLPVSPWQVLKAKLKLHLILTLIPAGILAATVLIVLQPAVEFMVLIPLTLVLYIIMMAFLGLTMNLKAPNLNWTNEIVPIKQSLSVTVTLFGGWGVICALGGVYFALKDLVSPVIYLSCVDVILAAAVVVLWQWVKQKGTKILARL